MGIRLGVDGGGTKTTAVLVDDTGSILAMTSGEASNPEWVGEAAEGRVSALVGSVLTDAGVLGSAVDSAYLGMAGMNSEELDDPHRLLFIRALTSQGIQANLVTVDNDAYIGMASAIGCGPGVAVVGGTGFNAVGRGQNGERRKVPWYVAGRGAGHILGRQAAMSALFEIAGAGPQSSVCGMVMDALNLTNIRDLIDWLSVWRGSDDLGRLCPLLTKAADAGDPLAIDMLATAGMEFGLAAVLVARGLELGIDDRPCPVATIGGVFEAGAWVTEPMDKVLRGCGVNAKLIRPVLPPVAGAILLARYKAGIHTTMPVVEKLHSEFSQLVGAQALAASPPPQDALVWLLRGLDQG